MSYWDRVAAVYQLFTRKDQGAYEQIAARMKSHLNKDQRVLEIGAGSGNLSRFIAPLCGELVATDASENMIAQARNALSGFANVRVQQEDVFHLSFPDQSFDCVVMANVLHILPSPEEALRECARVLRPGGWLIAPTYLRTKPGENSFFTRLLKLSGCHVYSNWTFAGFTEFLSGQGWTIVDAQVIQSRLDIAYIVATPRA